MDEFDRPILSQTGLSPSNAPVKSLASYQFSEDEQRVLEECNRESFFQRSLPYSTALGLGTYYAIQRGYFKASGKWGATPKVTVAVVIGYFLGKLSYQQRCAEKLMALPDSYVGQLLRDRQRRGQGDLGDIPPHGTPPMLGANPKDIYSDSGPGASLELDTDSAAITFDSETFKTGDSSSQERMHQPEHKGLTYDDLRKRNRSTNDTNDTTDRMTPAQDPIRSKKETLSENIYGDRFD